MRTIQHKREAFWFYRFLSIFYDKYVNPLFWTPAMRTQALKLANLNSAELLTLEVGSGTGFTTLGIIQKIKPCNVFCMDQSPHQMAKAKAKVALQNCHFQIGDAENLPFPDNRFDRYISAGSIEYWPDPLKAILETRRVLKPGGIAVIIGPLHPKNWLAKKLADIWMLFPKENDYIDWYEKAGFESLRTGYLKPDWVTKEKYGIAISGIKPVLNDTIQHKSINAENEKQSYKAGAFVFISRLVIGSMAGFLFIAIALLGKIRQFLSNRFSNKSNSELNESEKI